MHQLIKGHVIIGAVFVCTFLVYSVTLANHTDQSQSDFDQGTYTNTQYNSTTNTLTLGASQTSGSYTSPIVNLSGNTTVPYISWTPISPIGKELPNNGVSETVYATGNANMTNNQLLMHMNDLTLQDSSPNSYTGSCTHTAGSCLSVGSGVLGDALYFDGNDRIEIADAPHLDISGAITYGAWFKANSFGKRAGIMSNLPTWGSGGYNLQVGTVQKIACGGGVYTKSNTMPVTGQRYHATCVYDGTQMKLYVNGVLQNDIDTRQVVPPQDLTKPFVIGQFYTRPGSLKFDGHIDEVFVFDRTLSEQEIKNIYHRGATKLSMQTRSCNDALCSNETFSTTYKDSLSGNNILPKISLPSQPHTHFQYKLQFETLDTNYKPHISRVFFPYNIAPTDITLSNSTVTENTTAVGTLSTTDPDSTTGYTYTLVAGTGSQDNSRFKIATGGILSFISPPDYESPSDRGDTAGNNTYSLRVRSTDSGTPPKHVEKHFIITVTDALEPTSGKSFTTGKTPTKKTTTKTKTDKKTTETKPTKKEKQTTKTTTPTKTPTNPIPSQTYGTTNCADSSLDENRKAYCFARKNAITTIDGYDNAMPMGNVYRKHFAKMMVNFSYNILNTAKVTTIPAGCTQYADMNSMDAEMQTYAQHACALGIMGVQADGTTPLAAFGSDRLLTRAQFATVVSRVLRGKKYNVTDKNSSNRADAHLAAMNTHGYLTYITGDRPQTNEKRVFAWIVLHRIASNT